MITTDWPVGRFHSCGISAFSKYDYDCSIHYERLNWAFSRGIRPRNFDINNSENGCISIDQIRNEIRFQRNDVCAFDASQKRIVKKLTFDATLSGAFTSGEIWSYNSNLFTCILIGTECWMPLVRLHGHCQVNVVVVFILLVFILIKIPFENLKSMLLSCCTKTFSCAYIKPFYVVKMII